MNVLKNTSSKSLMRVHLKPSDIYLPPSMRHLCSSNAKHQSRTSFALSISEAPLVFLIVGDAFGMSVFMQTHLSFKDCRGATTSVREFTLEEDHKKMMKKLDIENYSLSRIPRREELSNTKEKNRSAGEKSISRSWLEWWNRN